MSSYRPNYGKAYDYPPPPGAPYATPPLPRGPPPQYDQHRGGDSYRPPQADFSFRPNDSAPHFTREYMQENGPSRPRNNHNDNQNLNRARRRRDYKPRGNHRTAPADRPLLRHHDQTNSTEQMLGVTVGQKFMAAEDISDSDEEEMDESDSDEGQNDSNKVDFVDTLLSTEDGQAAEESHEPAAKRRALTSIFQNARDGASEPKWSNPDPYTVLPPVDEQRKRKDVVKLIRKARKEAENTAAELNQVAANDDFISFGVEDDGAAASPSPSVDEQESFGSGVPGALSGPRSFSHLQNLHGQELPKTTVESISTVSLGPQSSLAQASARVAEEIVLDTPQDQSASYNGFAPGGDEALGNRKRTYDDNIKGQKKGAAQINGSILRNWVPLSGMNPTPWLRNTGTLTANAGFRLHKEICDFYDFVKPLHFEQTIRQELLSRLQHIVSDEIPHASVVCFGSFAAGMYLPNADMDVVVVSNSFRSTGQKIVCQTANQIRKFADFVRSSKLGSSVESITSAKVPLVKFVDRLTGIRVDVSFENDTGIIANDTFANWKRQYSAMPVLVTVIKQFLMMRGLNEVVHGGLGGFSVTCLVTSLLQNMPRVQSGELVPEQHLGELLIEFLDFYGNRLDTTRTGIVMRPAGYFEKQTHNRPKKYGRPIPVYQSNKADRLAIMDPNRADNDISGGSRLVMLIFERFARAHKELLQAMKSPGRISLLDWSLGGNYESFAVQRNRLRELYDEGRGTLGDVSDQYQIPEVNIRGGNAYQDEAQMSKANGQDTKVASKTKAESKSKAKAPKVKKSKTKDEKTEILHKKQAQRAADLKASFPDMEGIPERIGHGVKAKLIAEHAAKGAVNTEAAQSTQRDTLRDRVKGVPVAKATQPELTQPELNKGQMRARALKKQYPGMGNIPDRVGKKQRQNLIDAYKSQLKEPSTNKAHTQAPQQAPRRAARPTRKSVRLAQLPEKVSYPPVEQGQQASYPTRQLVHHQETVGAPVSNKMAPLSDERHAEVVRNLEGTSNEDPINLD